jgi:hypothetical protein
MGMLRIISKRGDDRLLWDEENALVGDAEAIAAIKEAEQLFVLEQAKGSTAFRVNPGSLIERLERFDPHAKQIVMVPRVVGG